MLITKSHDGNYSEMENKQKVLNLLGLARRAGKITTGSELVLNEVRNNKAHLVFVANDSGKDIQKRMADKCTSFHVVLDKESFTQTELSIAIGQKRTVLAVCDIGFAKKMRSLLD